MATRCDICTGCTSGQTMLLLKFLAVSNYIRSGCVDFFGDTSKQSMQLYSIFLDPRVMGARLGPKYELYSYMDPLGQETFQNLKTSWGLSRPRDPKCSHIAPS